MNALTRGRSNPKDPFLVDLNVIDGPAGSLTVVTAKQEAPFPIRRVYVLTGVPQSATRGRHAHRRLRQLIVAVAGSVVVYLDSGRKRREFVLDSAAVGLVVHPMWWRELASFSSDAVVLVFADAAFDEADYIRDYEMFLEEVR